MQNFPETPFSPIVWTRAELLAAGFTAHRIRTAVTSGQLVRLRRDRYAHSSVDADVAEAVRIGGRLACVSLLANLGVFVRRRHALHVQLDPRSSRIRSPLSSSTVLHWAAPLVQPDDRAVVSISDALAQAISCQPPRDALATIDSAVNKGLLTRAEVDAALAQAPSRLRILAPLIDGSAESGPETFARLILRALGVHYRTQVVIRGVGRVDFLVDGWLIIQCDSRAHHGGWEQQIRDRERDLAAARQGYVTIRLLAADLMERPDRVRDSIRTVLDAFEGALPVGTPRRRRLRVPSQLRRFCAELPG